LQVVHVYACKPGCIDSMSWHSFFVLSTFCVFYRNVFWLNSKSPTLIKGMVSRWSIVTILSTVTRLICKDFSISCNKKTRKRRTSMRNSNILHLMQHAVICDMPTKYITSDATCCHLWHAYQIALCIIT
jgi:hypothetical protein